MAASWKFYRFDYDLYVVLRSDLRVAQEPDSFLALSQNRITETIVEALSTEEIEPASARNAFVQTLCCPGEPLPLDPGLLRIVARLAHTRGTEDMGEQLEALLGGGLNLEPWMTPAATLSNALLGFLTPEQTREMHVTYGEVFRTGGKGRKRRRRGGLVGKVGDFVRQLLVLELKPEESLALLGELITSAAERGEGIAVTSN
jgi:hypothetical protein